MPRDPQVTRRRFLRMSAAAGGLSAGLGFYTWQWEPHWLEIVERPLPIGNLPIPLRGARLVQLSDLHIGPRVDDTFLRHAFDRVQDLAPDIVVYTGDLVTVGPDFESHSRRMFPHLPHGKRATFGIPGNHDYGPGWSQPEIAARITAWARDEGVRILRNEVAEAAGLQVLGLDDLWARSFRLETVLDAWDPRKAALALSHNPDTADLPGWEPYHGWILSGHTHGGQCKPPWLPPPLLPVRNRRYTSGEFALPGGRRMYINRGLGHSLQVRFNARPEITVFQLQPA